MISREIAPQGAHTWQSI